MMKRRKMSAFSHFPVKPSLVLKKGIKLQELQPHSSPPQHFAKESCVNKAKQKTSRASISHSFEHGDKVRFVYIRLASFEWGNKVLPTKLSARTQQIV